MLISLIVICIALFYLAYETKWFTIQLENTSPLFKVNYCRVPLSRNKLAVHYEANLNCKIPQINLGIAIFKSIYMVKFFWDNTNHAKRYNGLALKIDEWKLYDELHAKEIGEEQKARAKEQAEREAYRKVHYCPICERANELPIVKTETITSGNSTCHVTGCPDCLAKYKSLIDKAQSDKIRQPVIKTAPLPLFIRNERVGSHRELDEKPYYKHPINRIVTDYKTFYDDCLCGKEWLETHANDVMPEPLIEIFIDGKSISVNGNYKQGMIEGFMGGFTHKERAGKKGLITVMNGEHLEKYDTNIYIACKDGEHLN